MKNHFSSVQNENLNFRLLLNLLVWELIDVLQDTTWPVADYVAVGQSHVSLSVTSVVETPICDWRTRNRHLRWQKNTMKNSD